LVNVVLAFPCRWSNLQLASQHYMDSQCNILSTTATIHHMSHAYNTKILFFKSYSECIIYSWL
jgi:hypothetical protein